MELTDIRLEGTGDVSYVFLTDIHYGSAGFDVEQFTCMVDRVAEDSSCYWIGGGDYAEFIPHTDKRFDPLAFDDSWQVRDLDDLIMEQAVGVRDLLLPIKEKCKGLHWGNHDAHIAKQYHFNVTKFLCRELHTPCLSYTALLRVKARRQYTIYSTHGGVGRLEYWANKVVKGWDATIYQKGHTHEMGFVSRPRVGLRSGSLHMEAEDQLFLVGGCWKRAYQEGSNSYEETREYPPNPIGNYKITLHQSGEISCRRA